MLLNTNMKTKNIGIMGIFAMGVLVFFSVQAFAQDASTSTAGTNTSEQNYVPPPPPPTEDYHDPGQMPPPTGEYYDPAQVSFPPPTSGFQDPGHEYKEEYEQHHPSEPWDGWEEKYWEDSNSENWKPEPREENFYKPDDNFNHEDNYNHEEYKDPSSGDWQNHPTSDYQPPPQGDWQQENYEQPFNEQWKRDILRGWEKFKMRELDQMERNSRESPDLASHIGPLRSLLKEAISCVSPASTQSDLENCEQQYRERIDQGFEKAHNAQQAQQSRREMENLDRIEEKDFARMEREGLDTSELRKKLKEMKSLLQRRINATDWEEREDLQWEMNDAQEEFWESMNRIQSMGQFVHMEKECGENLAREIDRRKKDMKRGGEVDNAVFAQLDNLIKECKSIVARAKKKAEQGEHIDGWELGEEIREKVWEKFEKLMHKGNEKRFCKDVERGIKDMQRGVHEEAPRMLPQMPESIRPQLKALMERGKSILADTKNAMKNGDCERAGSIMQQGEEMGFEFRDILESAGLSKDDLDMMDHEDDYDDFYEDFREDGIDFDRDDFKRSMKNQRAGIKELDLMKKMDREVLADFLRKTEGGSGQTLQFASDVGMSTTQTQSLIRSRNELMEEVSKLKDEIKTLRIEVSRLKEEITQNLNDYNFGSGPAKDKAKNLARKLVGMNDKEAEKELEKIKSEAREEKVSSGMIAFPDADDTPENWFAPHALKAKNVGWIKGNADGTLNPGGTLNYSEAVVAIARIKGETKGVRSTSAVAKNVAPWARGSVALLESSGVDLTFMESVQAGDPIKREEIALLLNEVLNLPDVAISTAQFTDMGKVKDQQMKQAIANVKAARFMIGKGGTTEFGVGENLSRAALTKVLSLASEHQ
jgi:hypothetical protein